MNLTVGEKAEFSWNLLLSIIRGEFQFIVRFPELSLILENYLSQTKKT